MWFILIPFLCSVSAEPVLEIKPAADGLSVQVTARSPGTEIDAKRINQQLALRLVDKNGELGPAILGKFSQKGDEWVFTPRYRLSHDQLYRATWRLTESRVLTRDYRTPKRKTGKPPRVIKVYPSTNRLPENHLKFYIFFSQPMREGRDIFDQIWLEDEDGQRVLGAWRRTELWSKDARRFTLWIHPGRVKTGVNLREDEGPVLVAGRRYSLVIGPEVQDSQGNSLEKRFIKKFQVTAADHDRPLPSKWKLTTPAAGTRESLKLEFGEPLDYALLHKFLEVQDEQRKPVPGTIQLGENESSWEFRPQKPWQDATYRIQIDDMLEDLAGNTPARVFDTDLEKPKTTYPKRVLTFQPK